jgi:hypothetical protein
MSLDRQDIRETIVRLVHDDDAVTVATMIENVVFVGRHLSEHDRLVLAELLIDASRAIQYGERL